MLSCEEEYTERQEFYTKWREENTVLAELEPGDLIDVRDTLHIWCVGQVKEVIRNPNQRPNTILVHYKDWNSIYDEFIPTDSYRITPYGTFSTRLDLPKYLHREANTFINSGIHTGLDIITAMHIDLLNMNNVVNP